MTKFHTHASHLSVATRLKRAEGHLHSVIGMIQGGRPCLDVAQQLQAVEGAIRNAKLALIHDHMDHCPDAEGTADHTELPADHPHLREYGKESHQHSIVIDDLHPRWPYGA